MFSSEFKHAVSLMKTQLNLIRRPLFYHDLIVLINWSILYRIIYFHIRFNLNCVCGSLLKQVSITPESHRSCMKMNSLTLQLMSRTLPGFTLTYMDPSRAHQHQPFDIYTHAFLYVSYVVLYRSLELPLLPWIQTQWAQYLPAICLCKGQCVLRISAEAVCHPLHFLCCPALQANPHAYRYSTFGT